MIISQFFQSKEYFCFDKDLHVSLKKLNFFQRIARSWGFYKDTHLHTVADTTQKMCFLQPEKWRDITKEHKRSLLRLFTSKQGDSWKSQLEKVENEEWTVEISGRINYESCYFDIKYQKKNGEVGEFGVQIGLPTINKKDCIEQKKLYLLNMCPTRASKFKNDFTTNPKNELSQIAYPLVAKILQDSSNVQKLEIQGSRSGTATVAKAFGFTNTTKTVEKEDPSGMILEKSEKPVYEGLFPESISVDFLIDPGVFD